MKKISSRMTFYYKRLFPTVWFGALALFLGLSIAEGAVVNDPMFLVVPIVMAAFGYFPTKKLVWVLADEVYDCGDFLLVKNAGVEEQILLSNIMNMSVVTLINPPQITLRLIRPGKLGNEVTFSPAVGFRINPFAKSEVAEDLLIRVHRARDKHAV